VTGLDFMQEGLCAQTDPEAFYPEKGGTTRAAKAVCGACPVRTECLTYALESGERFGVWGGMSERERRRLLKSGTSVTITAERRVA
jgi:WhiB family redox-sensing transcriptional regulator